MSATRKFRADLTAANRGALRSATALGRVLSVAAAATALGAEDVEAGPKGGVVKAGSATITTRGGTTTINQAGQKVVIDWDSFDIDARDAVNFLQPGKDSIALNRVLNDLPTNIRGRLTANGNVWIVNQHGVTFHAGAMVNVGSLIATTADIDNADFMAGNYKFDKPGDPNARIINEGDITFGEAGLAAFVAPGAANRGVIAGRMGKVVIAGNETFAVDLAGDGMWAFTLGEGANGASAANSGRIHNPGGYILISARAAQGMVDSNISVGGVVEATTARVEGGKIVLSGDGFVEVSGELDATGAEAGQVGGSIEVTGEKVHVTATAKIDASGDAGGGSIKIGGDYQGGGALKTASRTLVSEGAEIAASAIGQVGDGGEVIVWADEITGFFGSIRATGGANAGDGGFAEVSGKQQLAFDGMVDLSARNGLPGELLLDPEDIIITDAAGADDGELADRQILAGDNPGDTFTISDDAIEAALVTGSVTIAANNSITQNADASIDFQGSPYNLSLQTTSGPILLLTTVNPGMGGLTLNAGGDLTISGVITSAGTLDFDAGGSIALNSAISSTAGNISLTANTAPTGTVTFGSTVDGGDIEVTTMDAVALGAVNATGALIVTSSGAITQTGAITADQLRLSGAALMTLSGDNDVNSLATPGAAIGTLVFNDTDGVDLAGVSASTVTITASGAVSDSAVNTITSATSITATGSSITLDETGNAFGTLGLVGSEATVQNIADLELGDVNVATLTVNAAGAVTQAGATSLTVTAATSVTATEDILLANAANAIAGDVTLSGEDINLDAGGDITLGALAASSAASDMTIPGAGDVTISGGAVAFSASPTGVNDLDVIATGGISQTAPISITGDADLSAPMNAINLANGANDFQGRVDAAASSVMVYDANDLQLGLINADTLIANAALDITDQGARIEARNTASFTAGDDINIDTLDTHVFGPDVSLSADQIIRFAASGTLGLSSVSATNMTDVVNRITATGGMTLDGAITTAGVSDLTLDTTNGSVLQSAGSLTTDALSLNTGTGDTTFSAGTNDINTLLATSAGDISLTDSDGVTVGAVDAGALTLFADDAIDQVAMSAITLTGLADLTTTGDAVTLAEGGNDFAAIAVDTTSGGAAAANVSITEANDAAFGDITAASLTITAGGNITQTETTTITATGATTLSGVGSVTLGEASNDFTLVTGSIGAAAFADANGIAVEALTATSDFSIDAGGDITLTAIDANAISAETTNGAITQTGGTITTAVGTAVSDFTATVGVTLDQAGNNFGGPTGLSGQTVTIRDTDALVLDDVTATGALVVNAGGAVSQYAASSVTVTETATVTATGQTINLGNDNDFQSTFVATGADVTVSDTDAIELGAIAASTLTIEAGGAVSQSAGATVANETTVTAAGQAVDLNNAANAFTGVVNATGGAVEIDNTIALGLGDITATTLDAVAATGNVTNAADDVLSVTGTATITSTAGSVTIASNAMNAEDLRQTVTLSAAGDVSLTGVNAQKLVLGDVTSTTGTVTVDVAEAIDLTGNVSASAGGDAVTLRSAGDITQTAGSISAAELTIASGGNAVSLTGATNDVDTLTLGVNGAVNVVEADGLAIGREAGGGQDALTVRSTGAITQASSLTVTNNAGFVTEGASITLNAVGNAFGTVSADTTYNMAAANAVTINEADATVISAIAATSATVTSGGAISQTGPIGASANSSFTASGDINLTNLANDFADTGSGSTAAFSGVTVNVTDADTLALGAVTSSASATITADDAGTSGNFSGGLTELRFFDTDGDMVLASSLVLPATVVNFTADSVGAIDAQSLTLTNAATLLDAATSVTFSTGAGTFASLTVSAPGGVSQTAPITVTGATDLNAPTSQIALGYALNDFQGRVDADASRVTIFDANNLELALINSDTLVANAGGDITDQGARIEARNYAGLTAGDDILIDTLDTHVFGDVSLSADQITHFAASGSIGLGPVTASNMTDVVNRIIVTGGVTLDGAISTAGLSDLTLETTNGSILQQSGALTTDALRLDLGAGDGTFVAGANDINTLAAVSAGDVSLTDTDGVTIATVSASTLTVTAGAAIDQQAMSTVTLSGLADLTATGANITLDEATNDFAAISAEGADLTFRDANDVELTDIDASGALSVTALGGDITDGDAVATPAGSDINVVGTTTLIASGAITLDDASHDFGGAVSADGAGITLRDANSLILGDIDATDMLVVDAVSGGISQDGDGAVGGDISAAAEATFTAATTITLTDASNDFTAIVNANGSAVSINDLNALELGDIDATSLAVTAGATIDDGAAGMGANADIDVTGTTTLTALGAITLDDGGNDFGQAVSADGDVVVLRDADNIILGEIAAGGGLTVTAAGAITDSPDSSVTVTGATTLTASDTGAYFDIALDNDTAAGRHGFGGAVNATGQDITLIDRNGVTLGAITTNGGAPDDTINVDGGADATDPGELIVIARGGAITQDAGSVLTVTGDATLEAADGAGGYFDITLTNAQNAFDSDNADAVGDGDRATDSVTFLGETVVITDTGPLRVFNSVANAGGVLTAQTGDLTVERLRVNAANGPLIGIAQDGAIDADDLSGGSITLGGAGSADGAATAASGVVTVDNFAVGALAVASDISTSLTNGDAGDGLKVAAPLQTFTFVTADAFTDGAATDFNALTGSTADQLILERIAFDGDITIAAGDVDLGHIDAADGFFVTALTGNVSKRPDAEIDFGGSAATGFTVAGARGAADQAVTLQSFDSLLHVGGAASFTATGGDVVITRGGAKQVDLEGPVSIAATDVAIEDQNSLILGLVAVGGDFAIRINADNANAAAETLTQAAGQTITVGGELALITGAGDTDRSDVTLTSAGNIFSTVSALAGDLSIRGGDAFTLQNSDLTGGLTIGSAAAQHGGDLTVQDVRLGGDLAFDATGATTLNRLDVAAVTGQAGAGLTVANLSAADAVSLTTTGGALSVTDVITGAFDFDSAGALTVANLVAAGSADGVSTAAGDITIANIITDTNASFDSTGGALDIDSARIGSTLTLSASGDITLGAIATGADLSATSDAASVLIRDGATEAPADFTVGGVQAADIGFASGPLIGDLAGNRVIEGLTGTADQTVDPADFTLQLAIGGDAAFSAAGSVLLTREAVAEGGFQNDFMGDVAISAAGGDVVIEDANALSFATVTITAGDLTARSNANNTGAGEGITQTAAIAVGGTASFVTGDHGGATIADEAFLADVTLGSEMNDFTGAVTVIADNATLADVNAITVANSQVASALSVDTTSAGAGDVAALTDTQSGGATTVTSGGGVDLDQVIVGGALTATGQDLTANDLAVTGATTLTAATTIAVDDSLLADATIMAGASGALGDVSAQIINVETGGVTIAGLSAAAATITSTGAGDAVLSDLSVTGATDVTAGGAVSLDQISLAATTVTADGDLSLTNGQTAAATLNTGKALTASNLRTGALEAAAIGDVTLDALQIAGDAAILSTDGDIALGSVAVAGQLTAESEAGAIRTIDSDFVLGPVTVTGGGAGTAAAAPTLIGEETNTNLLVVGGDAYFMAASDIALVDDEAGVTGDNDFMGGVTAISDGSIILNDANDLVIGAPTGVARPGGRRFLTTGITAANSLRIETGGSITDAGADVGADAGAPQATVAIGGDARLLAGGDILLDNETHAIGGAVAARGQNITLTEVGSITLGPINASGDLMVEAGANNAAPGGTLGDAAILQGRAVTVANADISAEAEDETIGGAIQVTGASTFTTGLDPRFAIGNPQLTGRRDLVLDSRANDFGGRLNIARIAGDATITENSQDDAMPGEQRIGNFEIGGTTRLTTTDNIVFIGRMTALTDDVEPENPLSERPEDVAARRQGGLGLADDDLRLFIATGGNLIIDTTGGQNAQGSAVRPAGANVRFDRAVDGDNDALPLGGPSISADRDGLGGLTINAGANGEIRFRDFVGASHPLGDVTLSAGDIFAGFTFERAQPDLETANFTRDNRFLFDRLNQDDFFFARDLKVNAARRIEFLTPFRTVENFILLDQYFGVNIASLVFGGLEGAAAPVGPEIVQSFGFIGNDRSRATGLFPRGPQGGNFQFNDCVIGDVADCTNIPIPNVVNNILTPAPPLLGIDTEDLLELFGSFGNEELWGVPQSYYSDLGVEPENRPDRANRSDDDDSSGS